MKEQHQLFDKLRMNYRSRKLNCISVERKAQLYKHAFWHGSMILPRNLHEAKNRLVFFPPQTYTNGSSNNQVDRGKTAKELHQLCDQLRTN